MSEMTFYLRYIKYVLLLILHLSEKNNQLLTKVAIDKCKILVVFNLIG